MMHVSILNERIKMQFSFFKSNINFIDLSIFGLASQNIICLPIVFTYLTDTNTNSMNYCI